MKAYQLKLTFTEASSSRWCRLLVPTKLSFSQLSVVINTCFSLENGEFSFVFEKSETKLSEGELDETSRLWEADASMVLVENYFEQEKACAYWWKNLAPAVIEIEWEAAVLDRKECFPEIVEVESKSQEEDNSDLQKVNEKLAGMQLLKQSSGPITQKQICDSLDKGFFRIRGGHPREKELIEGMMRTGRSGTMEPVFACYEKKDLAQIAENHGLAGFSELGKKSLIRYVYSRVMDPAVMSRYLLYMTEKESRAFRRAIAMGGRVRDNDCSVFDYAGCGGYVGFRSRTEIEIPREVCQAFADLDDQEFEKKREKTRKVLNYLNTTASLYGTCPMHFVQMLYKKNEDSCFSMKEAKRVEAECPTARKAFLIKENRVILLDIEEERMEDVYLEIQRDLSYYEPDARTVFVMGEENYLPFDSYMEALEAVLWNLTGEKGARIRQLCGDIQYYARMGNQIEDVIAYLEECGVRISSAKMLRLKTVMEDLWEHTRMISYRGHTPAELKKTEEQKIVRFSTWSTLRIHPNDLCPCGSGKCYRKCCGRKKV